jgi:hypothetical protein
MAYSAVQIHDLDGRFLGFGIRQDGSLKLHSANLWAEEDADDLRLQLSRLNDQRAVLAYWPDVRDPEVKALTDDPTWEPLVLSPIEVIDEEKSIFVWIEEPNDENPFGRMDPDRSVLVHKFDHAPAPTDVQQRIKKACEIVARKRAEAADEQG